MRESISACLIVQNEVERLPDALASVSFCDEVIVVDGGSSDGTVAVARAAGARVIENPWPGFAAQRNVALDAASSRWILELDADERVSPSLRSEIEAFLERPPQDVDIVAIPIRHRFLGRDLGPSAKYPGYRNRLFARDAYRHDETRTVHEGLWSNGVAHVFQGDLEHLLATSWREALADTRRYARLEAEQTSVSGALAVVKEVVVRPTAKVAFRVFVLEGWRDGWQGLAKISLDALNDALVAAHSTRLGRGRTVAPPPRTQPPPRGPVRIAGLAPAALARQTADWLERASAAGAEVVLVTDAAETMPVRTRTIVRLRYAPVVTALDSENQLRTIDVVLAADARCARLIRRLPGGVRGGVPAVTLGDDPADVIAVAAARREPSGASG